VVEKVADGDGLPRFWPIGYVFADGIVEGKLAIFG